MVPSARVKLNAQGRLVIPAELRCMVGLHPGETVVVRVVDDHIELLSEDTILRRMRARAGHVPPGTLVSEELIADRRAEAARERA